MRPQGPRDPYAGPEEGPEKPFPIKLVGPVIKGFGRGAARKADKPLAQLGIPTANIPPSGLAEYPDLQSGVYFGFVGLRLTRETTQPADNSKLTLSASASETTNFDSSNDNAVTDSSSTTSTERTGVYPSVLSIGYNPFYSNPTRSIEIHILHNFPHYNFYHAPLNLLILGFIRPEYDYESLEALVDDIKTDCDVARRSLEREGYVKWKEEAWLREFAWSREVDAGRVEAGVLKGDKEGKEDIEGKEGEGKL